VKRPGARRATGRLYDRAMSHRPASIALTLTLACVAFAASGAGPAPIAVQERPLVLPRLPAGTDQPTNVPQDGAVKLPFVTGGPPGVAQRINAAVWRELLDGAVAPTTPGKTWTPPADKLPPGTMSLEYTVQLIPAGAPRLLALGFSFEGCGASCDEFIQTHVFDLRDGREVVLGDLLTVEGFAAVGHRLDAERRRAYQKQLRELQGAMKSVRQGSKNADDDTGDRVELNRSCLQQVAAEPSSPWWLVGEVFALDGHGGLALTKGRCSSHAQRALDDVGDVTVRIPATELRPWLTPYGLAVLRQQGDAPPPSPAFDQRELHGTLGGMPITMKLEPLRDDADTRGRYAYDRYRTPIAIVVRRDGSQVLGTEQAASQGRFDLTISGGTLVGTWADVDGRKRLSVILQ
jgi:hypothetical protein